jgi:hypothetical protein
MLKKSITYTDFNGDKHTEDFYFNLTKTELTELEHSFDSGLEARLRHIVETQDEGALIQAFKKIILASYGQRSEDGKRFIKTEQMREEFTQTAAYDVLFMELATDDKAAAAFVTGILPQDIAKAAEEEAKKTLPPPPGS